MTFDVYFAFKGKDGKMKPGVKAFPKTLEQIKEIMKTEAVGKLIEQYRGGEKDAKTQLPAVCWVGRSTTGKRLASAMEPTQLVMLDIDHCENPVEVAEELRKNTEFIKLCGLIHVTPSGKGLRIVGLPINDSEYLSEQMKGYEEEFKLSQYGEFDTAVKDLSRLSFLAPFTDIIFMNEDVLNRVDSELPAPIKSAGDSIKPQAVQLSMDLSYNEFTENEVEEFQKRTYSGVDYQAIIKKYVDVYGEPGSGQIHTYYNQMVKNFRNICDNDKRFLLWLLPRFGHTADECWSQIVSITRVNTISRLEKSFYFFLKDNGFYPEKGKTVDDLKDYMLSENEKQIEMPPYLPPVFRELVGTAPKDFVVPCVNALMPILGTLTSYLRARYPYDNRIHSTSFFSIIYAPPGTGKGFVERFIDLLFQDLKLRDYVQSERENVYLRAINKKGANEKAPDVPHVSLRIIPPKNSEAEFLQKQRDNEGYHMFTYAAEMDSWAKGVRAAGGNKDDMIRIAWDNGEYGQQFKSSNTFKGIVSLYWNVLITGTIAQVENYFKNVENGLVTRCSFCSIDNQEFVMPALWKQLSKKAMKTIKDFTDRCDRRTYEQPCSINPFDLIGVKDEDFDKEVDWKFKFRPKQEIDMSWIMPTIDKFQKENVQKAALDIDRARDVFRRRVGVRGFRLAMICYGLWEKPRPSDLQKCIPFIEWWMRQDLNNMLNLWGAKYNEATDVTPRVNQRTVFDSVPTEFSRTDVYTVCMKQGIKTPVRRIIYDWKKLGYIEQLEKDKFKKKVK